MMSRAILVYTVVLTASAVGLLLYRWWLNKDRGN